MEKPDEYIESSEITNVYDHPYFSIVKILKLIICKESLREDLTNYDGYVVPPYFSMKIQYYNRYDDISLKERLVDVLRILENDMNNNTYEKSMFVLYFAFDIVTYCQYLDAINPLFLNHQLNLDPIKYNIVKNITILVESKEYDLLSMPYYTLQDLDTIKKNLAKIFSTLAPDASELQPKIGAKKEGSNEVDTYKLINHTTITDKNFEFHTADCTEVTINPTMPESEIKTEACEKIHYITYNSTIRIEKGPTIIDFDLIRSKINLVMTGSHFMKNGQVKEIMPLPSEFIDISIPRFDDSSNVEFIENLKRTSGLAYLLNLKTSTGKNITINSYGPDNIAHDLIRVLYGGNIFEPWLDAKFQKRIIRSVYFLVLTRSLRSKYTSDKSHLDNFLTFIDFCISTKNHIQDPTDETFWTILEKMLMSNNNVAKQDSLNIMKYYSKNLESKNEDSIKFFTTDISGNLISDEYHDVSYIVLSLIFWNSIISKPNKEIMEYINMGRNIYRYIPIQSKNEQELNTIITEIKSNLNKLLDTIINIGIKTYYLYNNFLSSGTIQNIKGGKRQTSKINIEKDEDIRQKYLKYKKKYLDAKKSNNRNK